ncbi:MAG: 2-amino-4-hydroxy-6-hydroxymethyldihydropteridine pyrophosphokinae [Bacteroidetes bacterium]|nr:2-amino-4-hydroxy-6-hydroxymethyldihydropteridine pyrophosphokinae [Bacteroidota bacterium]
MNQAYLILGGNIGNRLENLERTRHLITEQVGAITKISAIFVTAPWGNTQQPDFYNQALLVETELSAPALLKQLLSIEAASGRIRDERKWAERTMDIDILFYNEDIISEPHLSVPHPHIAGRRFVLAPLAAIAADHIHPVLHKSIAALLSECSDNSAVKQLEPTPGNARG